MSDASRRPSALRPLPALAAVACAFLMAVPAFASAATQEDKTQFEVKAGTLTFSTAPALPTLPAVTLNGSAQTTTTPMTNVGVDDATGSGAGWNVTVEGLGTAGHSAVFAAYCPKALCGTDKEGYVKEGAALAANSLTLNSTGASLAGQGGTTGTAPTLSCAAGCSVDSAKASKIIDAAVGAGLGTWLTSGFSATSLSLSTPSTLKILANEEVYRVNLMWTLSTGP